MNRSLVFIYVLVIAALIIFAIRLQLTGQMKVVEQALENQSGAIDTLRTDISTIATFLNERTSVRVQTSQIPNPLELESTRGEAAGENQ